MGVPTVNQRAGSRSGQGLHTLETLAMLDMGWRPPCTPTHSQELEASVRWPS